MKNTVSFMLSFILLFSFCTPCFAEPQNEYSNQTYLEILNISNMIDGHIEIKFKNNKQIIDKIAEIKSAVFSATYYGKLTDGYIAHLKNIMLLVEYSLSQNFDTETIISYLCCYYNDIYDPLQLQ